MSKNNENKLVPRLRFPEFEDSGEWVEKKLGEVFKSFSGGTPDTSKKEYYNGKIPFIRSAEIGKLSTELFITETGLENSSAKMVKKGDLLVALYGANSGDVAISKIDGAINQAILCFQSEYSNEFTCHFLSGKKNWIVSKYVQGGQGNLSGEIVKSISLPFPSLPEQQKIASCLSSLDEVITAESQKLELYQQHKKGLLQNLFPQEGETVPKLRFKDFEESGEWEAKRLGEVCEINPSICKLPKEFIYIDLESVENGQLLQRKKICIDNAPSRAQRLLRKSDIIFQMVRPYQRNNLLFNLDDFNYVASTGYAQLRTLQSPEFLYYQLHTDFFVFGVLEKCTGTNYPAINTAELTTIEIFIPSLPEQQKIASCLSSLDDLINAQRQKIELLKQHKKGLLQGLFPPINN
jgi:type I restriction enzyme S subunit